jgi:ribonuclease BN (tRNA processing enzyme)
MKLRVLGCSGGIGGNLHTTSFLLDHDVLIDAGTGVGELSLTEIAMIDHVFVTHSHLDHIACIPFMLDSAGFMRDRPLTVYASEETLDILKQHIFNWKIWPDFSEIPNVRQPYLRYQSMELGETVGYHLDSGKASLVFSGDTTANDALWKVVNKIENLRYLIIETAFSNSEKDLALLSKHLCPSMLAVELLKYKRDAEIFITHLKPGELELIMQEIEDCVRGLCPRMLLNNQEFEL